MKRLVVCSALLLTSLTLAAQNGDKTNTLTQIRILPPNSAATCPVNMSARQGVWDHTIKVRQGEQQRPPQPFGQRILLTLADAHPSRIVSATVTVHGTTGKNHMLQAVDSASGANATTTLTAAFTKQGDGSVSADIYVPGFTSVTSLELQQVSYADGSTLKINGSNACRVAPDPMMLIAAH